MCKGFRICSLLLVLAAILPLAPAADNVTKPKLVVAIIVDQFRYDYLTRFRSEYHGGFDRFLTKGATFTNARYAQSPTVTAVGHSIFMSGAMPSTSGIVGNTWYDGDEKKLVTSVCDSKVEAVGGNKEAVGEKCTDADPASPRRLLVSTLGDELRNAHEESKVIGVSIKARGAIMPSGHRANGAYWFDDDTGHFITSTFYMNALPEWASQFNARNLATEYTKRKWDGFPSWSFEPPPGSKHPFGKIAASPWGNELIARFSEEAITGEKLGARGVTDLLTVSFSSNDYIGHAVGPDAPEVRDMAIRTDKLLEELFQVIDKNVGLKNTVIVLSADHGVSPAPSVNEKRKMPGAYLSGNIEKTAKAALDRAFGPAEWFVPKVSDTSFYYNHDAIASAKDKEGKPISEDQVNDVIRKALLGDPALRVVRVYTRKQLDNGVTGDDIAQAFNYSYFPRRSADIVLAFEPFAVPGKSGSGHFSPWNYDRHVPMLFLGPGIKPGRYDNSVMINDVATTLATMLDIEMPSGSIGRVLTEMLAPGI